MKKQKSFTNVNKSSECSLYDKDLADIFPKFISSCMNLLSIIEDSDGIICYNDDSYTEISWEELNEVADFKKYLNKITKNY